MFRVINRLKPFARHKLVLDQKNDCFLLAAAAGQNPLWGDIRSIDTTQVRNRKVHARCENGLDSVFDKVFGDLWRLPATWRVRLPIERCAMHVADTLDVLFISSCNFQR